MLTGPSEAPPRPPDEAVSAGGRIRRRFPKPVIWVAVLALVANVVFYGVIAWLGGTHLEQRLSVGADDVIATRLLTQGEVVLATSDNEVRLVRDGEVTATAHIDATVHDVAPTTGGYLVASGAGVHLLDGDLREQALVEVTGAAVAVADTDAGPVVAHGSGQFTDQYWVSVLPPPALGWSGAVEPILSVQAPFTITALSVADGVAYYGTAGSHVGAIDLASGDRLWESRAPYEVRSVLAPPGEGMVLVGDANGGLTLIGTDGGLRGTVTTNNYETTSLGHDPATGSLLLGDASGRVHVFAEQGQRKLTQRLADNPIRATFTLPDGGVLAIPRTGEWALLDLNAIGTVSARGTIVAFWILANVVALGAMVGALVVTSTRRRARTAALLRRIWRGRQGYLFVLAAVVMVAYFFYVPSGMALFQSFTDFSLRSTTEWVGLENYERAFQDPYVQRGIVNMVIITVTGFIKVITVPLLAAELVYWLRNSAHGYVFRTAFVWASIPPGIVTVLLWRMIYDPFDGLLNNMLEAMGLEGLTRAWLGDESTAIWAIVGMGFPYLSVFAFLIFLGGLLSVNRELYDSAAIDGAGMWQRFRYIDLTHLLPQFRILVFLAITGAIEAFAAIFILTKGGPGYATYVPALQMYMNISRGELGYASAIGVLLSVLSLVAAWLILRFRRSVTEEAE